MTNGDFVSSIQYVLKGLNKDTYVSRRHILSTAKSILSFYLSQKLKDRSLFREDSLFTYLDCVELESDNIFSCDVVQFRKCTSVMKSVKKIEGLLYSRYGSSIVSVTSLDGSERYEQTTPNEYSEKCNLPFADVTKYYYVKDGHLYLPNSKIQAVNLVLITTKEESLEGVSSCQDSCDCKSVWDYEFKAPDRLLEVVRTETAQKISQTIQIPTDENPNLDSNQRTAR